jgi:hypothetical protein
MPTAKHVDGLPSECGDVPVAILRAVPKANRSPDESVKTTVELPAALWRAAKIRAMDERVDLRTIFVRALERFLDLPDSRPANRGKHR